MDVYYITSKFLEEGKSRISNGITVYGMIFSQNFSACQKQNDFVRELENVYNIV